MQSTPDALYYGFSNPLQQFDESLLQSIVQEYGKSIIEIFVEHASAVLQGAEKRLIDQMRALATAELRFEMVWSSALGRCLKCIDSGDELAYRRVSAELLLHAAAGGMPGNWEVNLGQYSPFLWQDWRLPKCDYLAVESDGERACIRLHGVENHDTIFFGRTPDSPSKWHSSEATSLPSISLRPASAITILAKNTIDQETARGLGFPAVPEVTEREYHTIAQAMDLLRQQAPLHYSWVARVIRRVVVIESGPQRYLRSGSEAKLWGLIYVCDDPDPLSIAEILVHEASHQYFYLLTRLGDPVSGTSARTYYSPFVDAQRRLDRILLAYHAFSNVYLFYREFPLTAQQKVRVRQYLAKLLPDIKSIEGFITDSDELTPIGRGLVGPLINELNPVAVP